jgi:glucan phosphoethanolaminetransferase (alkaline phosphatase superfamily)
MPKQSPVSKSVVMDPSRPLIVAGSSVVCWLMIMLSVVLGRQFYWARLVGETGNSTGTGIGIVMLLVGLVSYIAYSLLAIRTRRSDKRTRHVFWWPTFSTAVVSVVIAFIFIGLAFWGSR